MRVNQAREFVIGGYARAGRNFDAILISDLEEGTLEYVAKVRAGFGAGGAAALFKQLDGLETKRCPFNNLPEARRGRWGAKD